MNKIIRILLDSRDLGGIESHVQQLACGLARHGHATEILFWADYGPHPLAPALDAAQIPHRALDGRLAGLRAALPAASTLILHTHGYKAGILGRIAARLQGIPVVSTFHAGEPGTGLVRLYNLADRWSARLGGRIAVSAAIARHLPAPVTLLPNFVDLPDAPMPGAHDSVGFVGRFSLEKGPDLFCALADRVPECRFEAFGDGPMRATLAARPENRVIFHGRVAPMTPHWGGIGLLVMPSRHEGLPLAALEAMAQGIPVAGFAVGGLPALIADGVDGFLAPQGDLAALAGAIRHWATLLPDQRAALGQAARAKIAAQYGVDAGIAAVLRVYRAAGATI